MKSDSEEVLVVDEFMLARDAACPNNLSGYTRSRSRQIANPSRNRHQSLGKTEFMFIELPIVRTGTTPS